MRCNAFRMSQNTLNDLVCLVSNRKHKIEIHTGTTHNSIPGKIFLMSKINNFLPRMKQPWGTFVERPNYLYFPNVLEFYLEHDLHSLLPFINKVLLLSNTSLATALINIHMQLPSILIWLNIGTRPLTQTRNFQKERRRRNTVPKYRCSLRQKLKSNLCTNTQPTLATINKTASMTKKFRLHFSIRVA